LEGLVRGDTNQGAEFKIIFLCLNNKKEMRKQTLLIGLVACITFSACKKEEDNNNNTSDIPARFQKIYGASDMYIDGDFIIIKSTALPDHKSPYYPTSSSQYEAYNWNNNNWNQNPNTIASKNMTFKIPLNPSFSSTTQSTSLGAMGIALNGVPFYNQYAGPNNQPLTNEINSFDQYYGHPQQSGEYHYHLEPLYLTSTKGKSALMGFLLDGFPVYGPEENGKTVVNADLDDFHGHEHSTSDYPDGIYHYHITSDAPYINGDGFKGVPGTVTN
jgi:hypothetical protein